jgi:hypothetical protein
MNGVSCFNAVVNILGHPMFEDKNVYFILVLGICTMI